MYTLLLHTVSRYTSLVTYRLYRYVLHKKLWCVLIFDLYLCLTCIDVWHVLIFDLYWSLICFDFWRVLIFDLYWCLTCIDRWLDPYNCLETGSRNNSIWREFCDTPGRRNDCLVDSRQHGTSRGVGHTIHGRDIQVGAANLFAAIQLPRCLLRACCATGVLPPRWQVTGHVLQAVWHIKGELDSINKLWMFP